MNKLYYILISALILLTLPACDDSYEERDKQEFEKIKIMSNGNADLEAKLIQAYMKNVYKTRWKSSKTVYVHNMSTIH